MMEPVDLPQHVLGMLSPEDLELLLNLNYRRPYERGEVVVAAGETVDRFYLVEEGVLCVEAPGSKEPRYLRKGQVFGSTSLIHNRPAQDSVVAVDDVILLTAGKEEIDWLTQAEPGTAARLLRALAAALAARNVSAPPGAGATPEPPSRHEEPSTFSRFADSIREARAALEELGPEPEDGAAYWARERIPAVSTAYRPVLKALSALVDGAQGSERERLAQLARREWMTLAGTSRVVERFHTRPTGHAAGYRGFNHIYRNVPEGDDTLGLLTDAWLLTRPFAEAVRERRTVANERVTREVLDRARPDRVVRILSIGCGPARSLADILEEPGIAEKISVTCVDDDQDALVHANNLLKSRAPRGDITFRQINPTDLTPDTEGYGGYDIIASLYTMDSADAAAIGRLMFTTYRWMHAHGVLELCVFGDAVPDWLLMEVLLDWRPMRHTQRELQDLVSRSPFKQSSTEVSPTPSGLNVFLRAVK
jgi:extracellular factor (EF) 3-hydroxypalmitic acid methyl ester biosynthesis protein